MKRRRGYFKHSNDASRGESLRILAAQQNYLAIALFWLILEECNMKNSSEIELYVVDLCRHYSCKKPTLTAQLAALRAAASQLNFNFVGDKVNISVANYAEYQETRGQKTNKNDAKNVPIKDNRLNIKIKDKENIKRKEKSPPPPSGITAENLANLWNELVGGRLPNVLALNPSRKKKILMRLKENSDAQYWEQVIKKILASDFLTGKNDRNWVADFDFLLKPDTHVKVIEGRYDNRKGRGSGYSI